MEAIELGSGPEQLSDVEPGGDSRSSRLWRSVWRTHFYAGFSAAPILMLLAVTGLVILYTEPIERAVHGDLVTVTQRGAAVGLDRQRASVAARHPGWIFVSVTPPKAADRSTLFAMTDKGGTGFDVYVDPYTGDVIGHHKTENDIVGLANRLHGNLNNEGFKVPVPSLAGVFGGGPLFVDAAVGDMVVEVFAGWGLVLAFTGAYLWWPRKKATGQRRFIPRLGARGRPRWRDLHAVAGTVLGAMLVFFVVTGLPWSAVWGPNWSFVASKVTPNEQTSFWEWQGPPSAVPRTGDLDRAGRRIPWASGNDAIPPSPALGGHQGHDGGADGTAYTVHLPRRN